MRAPHRFKRTVVREKRGGLSPYVSIRRRDRAIHRYAYTLSSHFLRSAIVPPMKPGVCRNISRKSSAEVFPRTRGREPSARLRPRWVPMSLGGCIAIERRPIGYGCRKGLSVNLVLRFTSFRDGRILLSCSKGGCSVQRRPVICRRKG